MVQPSLFEAPDNRGDNTPITKQVLRCNVRKSDPVTSQQAAQSLTQPALGHQRALVLEIIAELTPYCGGARGATAYDVHFWRDDIQQSVASRRCTDLARLGLIEAHGTRRGASGRELTVWVITDAGREAIT